MISEQLEALASKGYEVDIFIFKHDGATVYEVCVNDPRLISSHCNDAGDNRILFISDDTLEIAVQRAYDKLI